MNNAEDRIRQLEASVQRLTQEKAATLGQLNQVVTAAQRLQHERDALLAEQQQKSIETTQGAAQGGQQGGQATGQVDVGEVVRQIMSQLEPRLSQIEDLSKKSAGHVVSSKIDRRLLDLRRELPQVNDIYGFESLLAARVYDKKSQLGDAVAFDMDSIVESATRELVADFQSKQAARAEENAQRAKASEEAAAIPEFVRRAGLKEYKQPQTMAEAEEFARQYPGGLQ